MNPQQIKELRDKFFKECTNKGNTGHLQLPKVVMAPHDLFEWFKPDLQAAISDNSLVFAEWIDDQK